MAVWLLVLVDRVMGLHALTASPMLVATFVNTLLVPLCAGAVASATERQFDVAAWQTLLPVAAWKQWAIKAGVALGLTVALAVWLPRFLASITVENGSRDGMEPVTVMMICAAALYVSSLSRTGLRALLFTVPAIALAIATLMVPIRVVHAVSDPVLGLIARMLPFVEITNTDYSWWMRHGMGWLATGVLPLLLALGYLNHRTEDKNWRRAARHFKWLTYYAVAATQFLSLIGHLYSVGMRARGR